MTQMTDPLEMARQGLTLLGLARNQVEGLEKHNPGHPGLAHLRGRIEGAMAYLHRALELLDPEHGKDGPP